MAGGPGDRWPPTVEAGLWPGIRRTGREESPDTVVVGSQEPVTNNPSAALRQLRGKRATRLVTPGDGHAGSAARRSYTQDGVASSTARCGAAESRKVPQRIYRRRSSTVASRRETCETSSQSWFVRQG